MHFNFSSRVHAAYSPIRSTVLTIFTTCNLAGMTNASAQQNPHETTLSTVRVTTTRDLPNAKLPLDALGSTGSWLGMSLRDTPGPVNIDDRDTINARGGTVATARPTVDRQQPGATALRTSWPTARGLSRRHRLQHQPHHALSAFAAWTRKQDRSISLLEHIVFRYPHGFAPDKTNRISTVSSFLENRTRLLPNLSLVSGLRHDEITLKVNTQHVVNT